MLAWLGLAFSRNLENLDELLLVIISQTIPKGGVGHSWYPGLSSDTSSDELEAEATTESDVEAGDGADREQKKSKSKSRYGAKLNWT